MKEKNRLIIICLFISLTVIMVIIVTNLFNHGFFTKTEKKTSSTKTAQIQSTKYITKTKENKKIIVEIKGEVLYPGVYEFCQDEVLIIDVINIAGGLTKKADVSPLNLASIVENHECIYILGGNGASYSLKEGEEKVKININTCSLDELMTLDGIGDARANSNISYRKKNGFYTSIEDLVNYNIIYESVFEKIKDFITV